MAAVVNANTISTAFGPFNLPGNPPSPQPPIRILIFNRPTGNIGTGNVVNAVPVKDLVTCLNVEWSWTLPMGCDTASFRIPATLEEGLPFLDYFYRVRIFYNGVLAWAGWIDDFETNLLESEYIDVHCLGYGHALDLRMVENAVANNIDSGQFLAELVGDFIGQIENAPVASVLADCSVGTTVTSGYNLVNFSAQLVTLTDAVNQLAILGMDENGDPFLWYFDQNASFFYVAPSDTVLSYSFVGRDVVSFKLHRGPASQLVNNLFFTGTVGLNGLQAIGSDSNETLVSLYGQIDGTASFPDYGTAADLQQAAQVTLQQTATGYDRYQVTLLRPNDSPAPLTSIFIGSIHQVGGFTNGDIFAFRVVSQRFTMKDTGLELYMELNAASGNIQGIFQAAQTAATQQLNNNIAMIASGMNTLTFPFTVGVSTFGNNAIPGQGANTGGTNFPVVAGFADFGGAAGSGFYQPVGDNVAFTGQMWNDTMNNTEGLVGNCELGRAFRDDFLGSVINPCWSHLGSFIGGTATLLSARNGFLNLQSGTSSQGGECLIPGSVAAWVNPTKNPNMSFRVVGSASQNWTIPPSQTTTSPMNFTGPAVYIGYTFALWIYSPATTGSQFWCVAFNSGVGGIFTFTPTQVPYNYGTSMPMAIQILDNNGSFTATFWAGGQSIVTETLGNTFGGSSAVIGVQNDTRASVSPVANVQLLVDYFNITQGR